VGRASAESLLLIVFAMVATMWSLDLSGTLQADSWLTLLGGREITSHGLPHHDALAVISHDRQWIDQQWLAQLAFWEVYRLGGLGLVVRLNLALFMLPLALCLWAARRRGATASRILIVGVPALLLTGTFVRAQVLSELLFVPVFLLLLRESRARSWRILLVFPALVLWANLHGGVVVGAALVAALGATEALDALRRRSGARALARASTLLVLPWACVFATPYGLTTADYYRSTMHNPLLAQYVTEWAAPTFFSVWGMLFFPLAFGAVYLVARRSQRLGVFELLALAITLVGALLAVRSVIWFSYVCLIVLPPLLEDLWPARAPQHLARGERAFRVAATAASMALFLVVFVKPITTMKTQWPEVPNARIGQILAADPSAKVLATEEYADWVLFRVPAARGRIAFDGRWEVLSNAQFRNVMRYLLEPDPWTERLDRPYRLIVLDPKQHTKLVRRVGSRAGVRRIYLDDRVVIFERTRW